MAQQRRKTSLGAPTGIVAATVDFLDSRGYDTDEILKICDIPRSRFDDLNSRISSEKYFTFNRYLLDNTNVPGLGLRQGSGQTLAQYGLIGYAVISSENFYMAQRIIDRHRPLFGPLLGHHPEIRDTEVAWVCEGFDAPLPIHWCVEAVISAVASCIRQCLGERARFTALNLAYAEPDYADLYEEIFECPVRFSQSRSELLLPAKLLTERFVSANVVLRNFCLRESKKMLAALASDGHIVNQVEATITNLFTGAIPQLTVVAESLNMSPRTLHRRLASEGTTYRKVVEDLRKRLAAEFLTEGQMEQKEVAYLLGYADPANFYHAFQRWFNCTPGEFLREYERRDGDLP